MRRGRLFAGLTLTLLSATLTAQDATIPLGTRIRVRSAAAAKVDGVLLRRDMDSIVVRRSGSTRTALTTASILRIQVSEGRSHWAGIGRGAKYGAVAGTVILGVGSLPEALGSSSDGGFELVAIYMAIGATTGAMMGGLVGAVVGAERWKTVYGRGVRVSFRPRSNGRHSVRLRIN